MQVGMQGRTFRGVAQIRLSNHSSDDSSPVFVFSCFMWTKLWLWVAQCVWVWVCVKCEWVDSTLLSELHCWNVFSDQSLCQGVIMSSWVLELQQWRRRASVYGFGRGVRRSTRGVPSKQIDYDHKIGLFLGITNSWKRRFREVIYRYIDL